jgi:thiamine-monophosphate kinase
MTMDDVKRLYEGVAKMADRYACPLVGGDTTRWKGALAIDVAILAEPFTVHGPVLRSTAQTGDGLYVSGPLGGSILSRHLAFEPRLDVAEKLADGPIVHAMMDLSDGLSTDLHRMCRASGCAAELFAAQLEQVISDDARTLAGGDGRTPLEHALNDGEDFELLIAGGTELADMDLWPIGRMVPMTEKQQRVVLVETNGRRRAVRPEGYEHIR